MKILQLTVMFILGSTYTYLIAQPTISSVTPALGPVGTSVTITGTNFSATPANNTIYFGATKANVTSATTNSLSVTVPVGATYHLITVQTGGLIAYSDQPFHTTYVCGDTINASAFANDGFFTSGANPRSAPLGDLDGDGKADMVTPNYLGNNISVFLNNSTIGNISFAPKVDFASDGDPSDARIGDLDGDGKPEIVVANNTTQNVSVFLNTCTVGNASFATHVDFGIGNYGYRISICDLDEDGKSDIVALNANSNTVSILRNTSTLGSLSFAPKVDYTTGTYPSGHELIDLDGDGKPEIIVANRNSNTFSVFRNTCTSGTISFAPKVDFTTSVTPFDVGGSDLDGDGKVDLAVVNRTPNTLSLFRNTSTMGSISFAPKVDFVTDNGPHRLMFHDIDGGGQVDVVTANHLANTFSVFLNSSSVGSFLLNPKVDYATGGSNSIDGSIGDLDGDNKPDMVITSETTAQIVALRNQLVCLAGGLTLNVINTTNATCAGINDGSGLVAGSGGSPPYTYSWSPSGGTNDLATNLAPGVYTVTVTDQFPNTATTTVTIGEDFPVILTMDSMSNYFGYNVSCFGGNNGWINTSASGGLMAGNDSVTFNYTGAPEIYVVPAGVTQVTIKAWGAQGGANWVNNVNFGGYAQGDLSVTPGETLYVYVGNQPNGITGGFNGGGNGEGAGQGGGGASDVRQGGNTLNDRKIVGAGAGGAGYWSGMHVVGGIGGGLTGGDGYRNTPADPGGQGATQTGSGTGTCISFNVPAMAGGFGYGGAPSGCGCEGYGGGSGWYGGAASGNCRGGGGGSSYIGGVTNSYTTGGVNIGNGKVTIIYGGPEPLSYQWTPGGTSDDAPNLTAGNYICTVTSQSGCTAVDTFTIVEPSAIDANMSATNISCFGAADGMASSNPSGGVSPYTFLWTYNSDINPSINNLNQGVYVLVVTDAAGCTVTDSVSVIEPTDLILSATTVNESLGNDGSIDLTASGGLPPYSYSWSNSLTTEDISGLAGGTFTVIVTDSSGCFDSLVVVVGSTFGLEESQMNELVIYPNPTDGIFFIQSNQEGEFSLWISDISGRIVYSTEGNLGNQSIMVNAEGWRSGTYLIRMKTANGSFVKRIVLD